MKFQVQCRWKRLTHKFWMCRTKTVAISLNGFQTMWRWPFVIFRPEAWKCHQHSSEIRRRYKRFSNVFRNNSPWCSDAKHFCIGTLEKVRFIGLPLVMWFNLNKKKIIFLLHLSNLRTGMDEMEFTEAESNMNDLISEYQQYQVRKIHLLESFSVCPNLLLIRHIHLIGGIGWRGRWIRWGRNPFERRRQLCGIRAPIIFYRTKNHSILKHTM